MALNATIGKLNVLINGNADGLKSTLDQATKTVTGFAAKLASPLTGISGAVTGLGGLVAAPMMAFGGPLGAVMSLAAGGELAATSMGLRHLSESTEHAVERLTGLNNAASKTGLSPEFMRSLQIAAGPAADNIDKMMVKYDKFIVKLRTGDQDLTQKKTFQEKFGGTLDLDKIIGHDKEESVRSFIDALGKIEDVSKRNALAMEAFGKSGAEAFKLFEHGISESEEKVKKFDLANPANISAAVFLHKMQKTSKLMKEQAENHAAGGPGILNEMASQSWYQGNYLQWAKHKYNSWDSAISGNNAAFYGVTVPKHSIADIEKDPDRQRLLRLKNEAKELDEEKKLGNETNQWLRANVQKEIAIAEAKIKAASERQKKNEIIAAGLQTEQKMGVLLDEQIELLGKPDYWPQIIAARKAGFDDGQLKRMAHQFDWAEAAKTKFNNRSPLDVFEDQSKRLDQLVGLGGPLDAQTANGIKARGIRGLIAPYLNTQSPGLAEAGSQEFYAAIDRANNQSQEPTVEQLKAIKDAIKSAEAEQKKRDDDLVDKWNRAPMVRLKAVGN